MESSIILFMCLWCFGFGVTIGSYFESKVNSITAVSAGKKLKETDDE